MVLADQENNARRRNSGASQATGICLTNSERPERDTQSVQRHARQREAEAVERGTGSGRDLRTVSMTVEDGEDSNKRHRRSDRPCPPQRYDRTEDDDGGSYSELDGRNLNTGQAHHPANEHHPHKACGNGP